jgi:hypothetical protein
MHLRHNLIFYGESLLVPHSSPKLEDNPLSAVRGCLVSVLAGSLHGSGVSTIRNLRTPHAVVTRDPRDMAMPT